MKPLLAVERTVRPTLRLKPPYYHMRKRLRSAIEDGRLLPGWNFEEHWRDVEKALGGAGRHWIDHIDLDGKADELGIDYQSVQTVAELLDLLTRIGNRYRPGLYGEGS